MIVYFAVNGDHLFLCLHALLEMSIDSFQVIAIYVTLYSFIVWQYPPPHFFQSMTFQNSAVQYDWLEEEHLINAGQQTLDQFGLTDYFLKRLNTNFVTWKVEISPLNFGFRYF
jgi:hypothetical protein